MDCDSSQSLGGAEKLSTALDKIEHQAMFDQFCFGPGYALSEQL